MPTQATNQHSRTGQQPVCQAGPEAFLHGNLTQVRKPDTVGWAPDARPSGPRKRVTGPRGYLLRGQPDNPGIQGWRELQLPHGIKERQGQQAASRRQDFTNREVSVELGEGNRHSAASFYSQNRATGRNSKHRELLPPLQALLTGSQDPHLQVAELSQPQILRTRRRHRPAGQSAEGPASPRPQKHPQRHGPSPISPTSSDPSTVPRHHLQRASQGQPSS